MEPNPVSLISPCLGSETQEFKYSNHGKFAVFGENIEHTELLGNTLFFLGKKTTLFFSGIAGSVFSPSRKKKKKIETLKFSPGCAGHSSF